MAKSSLDRPSNVPDQSTSPKPIQNDPPTLSGPLAMPARLVAAMRRISLPRVNRRPWVNLVVYAAVAAFVLMLVTVAAVYGYVAHDLPPADQVITNPQFQTADIYDRQGRLLSEMIDPRGGKRDLVPIQSISHFLIDATIATEDPSFRSNSGVDWRSILRAFAQDLLHGHVVSGASTITQQLVRNVVMTPEERNSQSITRKIGEAILAVRVSERYTKDEILQRYLNEIYYGDLAYGAEAASESYFDKPVQQLDLAQAALLAGLPQGPSLYDPYEHPEAAKERQTEVLGLMVKHGAITQDEADAATQEPLVYHAQTQATEAPHFAAHVRAVLLDTFGTDLLYNRGLRIYTTLDLDLQHRLEAVVQAHRAELATNGAYNVALVAIDPTTGEIRALVGSADFGDNAIAGQVDMSTAARPPSSTIKPFTYLVAMDRHLVMPATVVLDAPVSYSMGSGRPPYLPQDADGIFRGAVTVRRALATSLNVPAIGLLDKVGGDPFLTTLHRFGISSLDQPASQYGLALALGDAPVSLLDLTYAYAGLANGGVQVGEPRSGSASDPGQIAPVAILKVTDSQGNVVEEYRPPKGEPLVSPQAAWLTTNILADDAARAGLFGAHSALELADRPAAVKTGTSEGLRDAWAIGYTSQLAIGVWVGNSDNRPLLASFGAGGPGAIWHAAMEEALQGQPATTFVQPPGLVRVTVDLATGLLPAANRPTVEDWFVEGTAPTTSAPNTPLAATPAPNTPLAPTPADVTPAVPAAVPSPTTLPVPATPPAPARKPGPPPKPPKGGKHG